MLYKLTTPVNIKIAGKRINKIKCFRRCHMFYEARVFDAYGNLKKTISSQELHARHWKNFQKLEEKTVFHKKKDSSESGRKIGKKEIGSPVTQLQLAS